MPTEGLIKSLKYHEIERYLPYRSPWIMIDRVLDWTPDRKIRVQKCISASDPLVASHFTDGPKVFPGVLLVELVGQAAYLLSRLSSAAARGVASDNPGGFLHVLVDCNARFSAPALVGDVVVADVRLEASVKGITFHHGVISSAGREIGRIRLAAVPVNAETWIKDK